MAEKLPNLKVVKGLDEMIPNGQEVDPYNMGDIKHRHPNCNREDGDITDSD